MCAEKNNIIRFPVEKAGKPPDTIEMFKREHRKKEETETEIDEPECIKTISDTRVIKNIIIKKYFDAYIKILSDQKRKQEMKDDVARNLAFTMESYDNQIKKLTEKVLKLSKIKSYAVI